MRGLFALLLCLTSLIGSNTIMAQGKETTTAYCPDISELVKDPKTLYWGTAQQHWRSYSMSFADKITHFLGAQWTGASVGTIFCLYKGEGMTFIVKLQFDTLVIPPSGGKWSKDLGQFKNCRSLETEITQQDCPFFPLKKPESKTLYEQLDELSPP